MSKRASTPTSLREYLATPAEYCDECGRILNKCGECPDPSCRGSVPGT